MGCNLFPNESGLLMVHYGLTDGENGPFRTTR